MKVAGNLLLDVGSTVNDVDVVAFNRSVVTLHGDQTIAGTLVGPSVKVRCFRGMGVNPNAATIDVTC